MSPLQPKSPRLRLDLAMVEQGKAPTRAKAQAIVMTGQVAVNGTRIDKPGTLVSADACIDIIGAACGYVSRGGDKLAGAIASFEPHGLRVQGKVAADFGASTGGFVDCLLQQGAARVHAVDVGHGLLHERLRADPRVLVHERTNARYLDEAVLGERIELLVVDASFIGLGKLLDAAVRVLDVGGEMVALIKPQFEAGKREVSRGRGVIRDDETRTRVIGEVVAQVKAAGFEVLADAPCAVLGPKGNREHFVYARIPTQAAGSSP